MFFWYREVSGFEGGFLSCRPEAEKVIKVWTLFRHSVRYFFGFARFE